MQINILILEEEAIAIEGLKAIINSNKGFSITGEASNRKDAEALLDGNNYNIIITDPYQSSFSSNNLVDKLFKHGNNVLVISNATTKSEITGITQRGAKGYLLKNCDREEITQAIKAVSRGERFFCGKVLEKLIDHEEVVREVDCAPVNVSPREIEIIRLLAEGCTTKDIASKLFLSIHTVNTHRKRILQKLGLKTASEVVLFASKQGLLEK